MEGLWGRLSLAGAAYEGRRRLTFRSRSTTLDNLDLRHV